MPGESAGQQARRRRRHAENLRAQAQRLNDRADRIERTADMWDRGLAGEQAIGAELDRLRPHGFEVLHDVRWPGLRRANIDHVAIGPPGILVVDAKNWSGNVTVHDGMLRQNGYRREDALDGVRQAGQAVGSLLPLPWALHVIPVLGLAGTANGVHRCQDITVVGHGDLVDWATGLPPHVTPGDVVGIAAHLRGALPPASVPGPRSLRRSSTPRSPREPSARQRRRAAKRATASREALVKLLVVLLLIVAGPTLLRWWAANGTEVVGAVIAEPTVPISEPTVVPSTPVFPDCRALRVAYPTGVRRPNAPHSGKPRRAPLVDKATYRANAGLDRDHDGVVCESDRGKRSNQR
jgi:hypothetical protein